MPELSQKGLEHFPPTQQHKTNTQALDKSTLLHAQNAHKQMGTLNLKRKSATENTDY